MSKLAPTHHLHRKARTYRTKRTTRGLVPRRRRSQRVGVLPQHTDTRTRPKRSQADTEHTVAHRSTRPASSANTRRIPAPDCTPLLDYNAGSSTVCSPRCDEDSRRRPRPTLRSHVLAGCLALHRRRPETSGGLGRNDPPAAKQLQHAMHTGPTWASNAVRCSTTPLHPATCLSLPPPAHPRHTFPTARSRLPVPAALGTEAAPPPHCSFGFPRQCKCGPAERLRVASTHRRLSHTARLCRDSLQSPAVRQRLQGWVDRRPIRDLPAAQPDRMPAATTRVTVLGMRL